MENKKLTKREYFAALSLKGLLSNSAFMKAITKAIPTDKVAKVVTKTAIDYADELNKNLEIGGH